MDVFSLEEEELSELFLTQTSSAKRVEFDGDVVESANTVLPLLTIGMNYEDISDDDFYQIPSLQKAHDWEHDSGR